MRDAFTGVGVFGHLARAVVFALMGYFLVKAAIDYNPDEAIGLDGALAKLGDSSYGPVLLGAVAVGPAGVRALLDARRPLPQDLTAAACGTGTRRHARGRGRRAPHRLREGGRGAAARAPARLRRRRPSTWGPQLEGALRRVHGRGLGRARRRRSDDPPGVVRPVGLRGLPRRVRRRARPRAAARRRAVVRRRARARALPPPSRSSPVADPGLGLRGLGRLAAPDAVEHACGRPSSSPTCRPAVRRRASSPRCSRRRPRRSSSTRFADAVAAFHPAGLRAMARAFAEADLRDVLPPSPCRRCSSTARRTCARR